ncbi:ATP-dependent DNA helicase PcrA [bioreactor metagenome]|uniref:DNA 3'-5' helicase n=1 Tax=bioreactor metagenome TaxID=1076179 RepID=A0A644XQC1_9ZZZZ
MASIPDALSFCKARREVIALDFSKLNPEQRLGVLATEGPLLLLAGAGSGKTTVLINRIANLIKYGRGSDSDEVLGWITPEDSAFLESYLKAEGVLPGKYRDEVKYRAEKLCALDPAPPWSILAITFTNKAAGELKDRLEKMLGAGAADVWAATFHSACVRILRRDIERLGFPRSFTIYDNDDSLRVIKDILKDQNLDDKAFPPRTVLGYISRAKDQMELARAFLARCEAQGDLRMKKIGSVYLEYESRLRRAGALDFDDLILQTVRLLLECEDVREFYQKKFRYILVDEYQDTNHLQYLLVSTLAGLHRNLCVVGDDDQSIYRFRGATIENILSFESQFKDARVIRLEQNYRSTGHILGAANAVISRNEGRKGKNLWTKQEDGQPITLYTAMNEHDEARYVTSKLMEDYGAGLKWRDHAILYRMNVQSNLIEEMCRRNAIPYRVLGGQRFTDTAEIRDMLAYLNVIHNPGDNLRLGRIINTPVRGIGDKTVDTASAIAAQEGLSLWEVISNVRAWPELAKSAGKLSAFAEMMGGLMSDAQTLPLPEFYEKVVERTGYAEMLTASKDPKSKDRLENIQELASTIVRHTEATESPSLASFLEEMALVTDLDNYDSEADCVVMMTIHAAKGLEFPVVFVVGAEEGIFPGIRAIGEPEEMEEERRLCYVAMTRAKEKLYMTCASQRMLFGRTSSNLPSRFVEDIPAEHSERFGRDALSPNTEPWGYRKPAGSFLSGGNKNGESASYGAARPQLAKPVGGKAGGSRTQPAYSGGGALPSFRKGDMVGHSAFGRGMVLSVMPMGGDALLEIAFDNVGTKRLMLKAAAQSMKLDSQ